MTEMMVWVIMLPLGTSLFCLLWPRQSDSVAPAGALLTLLAAGYLAYQVYVHGALDHPLGDWQEGLAIFLRADAFAALLVLMAMLVASAATFYAGAYFSDRATRMNFWPLWMMLLAAINGLLLSGDLFNLYVTLELLGLSAVALTALGNSKASLRAAIRYLTVGLLGSLMFLTGVALVYANYGTLDLLQLSTLARSDALTMTAVTLLSAGLLVKSALFPLHFWLPDAHSSAPAPVSAALSALVVKVSIYMLIRLWLDVFDAVISHHAAFFIGSLGSIAVLWGSWQAYKAQRLKLLAAFSTVAQVGYLFLFLALIATLPEGTARDYSTAGMVIFAMTHGFAKSALFLSAGVIQQRAGHDRISDLGGAARALPLTIFIIALSGVALIGLPPSGSFLAKWQLISGSFTAGQWWWIPVIASGSLLAAGYSFRVLGHAFAPGESFCDVVNWAREEIPALILALFAIVVLGFGSAGLWEMVSLHNAYSGVTS